MTWTIAFQILAIITFAACTVALLVAAAILIWYWRHAAAHLKDIAESLAATKEPLKALPELLKNSVAAVSEIKDVQQGEMNIMVKTEKSLRELTATVEEFQGMIFKPAQRTARPSTGPLNEGDEIIQEREAARRRQNPDVMAELGENVKHVADV